MKEKFLFKFEKIEDVIIDDNNNPYESHKFAIYRCVSTDVLWVEHGNSFCEMHDPETNLPLTYKVWQEKYKKD